MYSKYWDENKVPEINLVTDRIPEYLMRVTVTERNYIIAWPTAKIFKKYLLSFIDNDIYIHKYS